jgi:hypothetical protein
LFVWVVVIVGPQGYVCVQTNDSAGDPQAPLFRLAGEGLGVTAGCFASETLHHVQPEGALRARLPSTRVKSVDDC